NSYHHFPMLHSVAICHNDPPGTEIYSLSLHDALPIFTVSKCPEKTLNNRKIWSGSNRSKSSINNTDFFFSFPNRLIRSAISNDIDRKSTRLNSSHVKISHAVFCLKSIRTRT